jgi:parallel beta-helix repeat protein
VTEILILEIVVLLVKDNGEYSLSRKTSPWMLAFLLLSGVFLVCTFSLEQTYTGQALRIQQTDSPVSNFNTSRTYSAIQAAIDAPETLDGHEILVASGTYYEHVNVSKSVSLIGENHDTTIIDGNGTGKVVYVTADNVVIRNFTIRHGAFGVWLSNSSNSRIVGNKLQDGAYGLRLYNSRNSEVMGNEISGYTWFGVEIKESGNSTLRNNRLVGNTYNFGVNGNSLFDFINDIDVSNTVDGNSIRYLINQHDATIDASTFHELGYLGIVNSTNITVKNLNVENNKQGILFAFTTDSHITNVNAQNNWNGIYVAHSSNITVNGNKAHGNFDYGIKLFNSSRSRVSQNNVDNNGWAGIGLFVSLNSTVDGNEANFNTYNLHVVYTNNTVFSGNNALVVRPNGYSIAVFYCRGNLIYHNNLANSLLRVQQRNTWDNGQEGNYWSLYQGADTDQDGVGDTIYMAGPYNIDNHPLMGRFHDFTVTIDGKNFSITIVSNSTLSHIRARDNTQISFTAAGERETTGFSRIAAPNTLLQALHNGHLSFSINGEEPVLERTWTDETHTYFYFFYMNRVSNSTIGLWLFAIVASAFLLEFAAVFLLLARRN